MTTVKNTQNIVDTVDNITLEKKSENKYELKYGNKQMTLKIAPTNNQLSCGAYCFGIKQKTENDIPTLCVSLDNCFPESISFFDNLKDLVENELLKQTGSVQKVAPLITRSYFKNRNGELVKIIDENKALLNLRLKYNKKQGCLSIFKDVDGEIEFPIDELDYGFKGVYYIDVGDVTKSSKSGLWYVNLILDTCIVYREQPRVFGDEYL